MANFKRKKSRRQVKCGICTDGRMGNKKGHTGRRARVGLNVKTKSERKQEAEKQAFLEDIFRPDE